MRRAVVLGLLLLATFAPASAQEFEPLARNPDVRVPFERMREASPMAGQPGLRAATTTEGTFRLLVIPALFEDSPEPDVTPAQVRDIAFADEGRTLRTFYREMSGGRLQIEGEVPAWVRTDITTLDGAGDEDGHGFIGDSAGAHFQAAVDAVDPAIDFTLYDNDGPDGVPNSGDDDGFVDAVAFKFIEVSGSCGGPGFWPHRYYLFDDAGNVGYPTQDTAYAAPGEEPRPIRVGGYTTESAIECDGVTPQGPNVMAHEFGHILGLPDFYRAVEGIEPWQRHWHIGCFGLMAAGSWGCGDANRVANFGPTGLSPISRRILGWGTEVRVADVRDEEYVLEPVQTTGEYLRVDLNELGSEALLIEYRPAVGFDDQLPTGGVLVYHYDTNAQLLGGAYALDYPIHLLEADADGALRRTLPEGGNRGVATDVFARAGATDSITPLTRPGTIMKNGRMSQVWIHAIEVDGGVARVRITTRSQLIAFAVSLPTQAVALEPFEARYRIEGGQPPYSVQPGPGGFPLEGISVWMEDSEVVVGGRPLLAGQSLPLPFQVIDASGDVFAAAPMVAFMDAALTHAQLMDALLDPAAADEDVLTYLDSSGNGNGTFDVGDLRAYIDRTN